MNENLHDNSQLPISAELGWQKMHALLNEQLPVKETGKIIRLLPYGVAAFMMCVLLFTSISLNETIMPGATKNILAKTNNNSALQLLKPSLADDTLVHFTNTSTISSPLNLTGSKNDFSATAEDQTSILRAEHNTTLTVKEPEIIEPDNGADTALMMEPTPLPSSPVSSLPVIKPAAGKWSFYAGLGINIKQGTAAQNLQPYPTFTVQYNLTKHLYLATGISLYAPVATNVSAKSKSVLINDTLNNIRMYNEKVTYSRLHYVDIPLSAGVHVTKHISVEGGVQLSVLLNKRKQHSLEHYDFQMRTVSAPAFSSMMAIPTNPPGQYDNKLRQVDYRVTAGIKYNISRFSAGITLQKGLAPVQIGSNIDKKKNNVIALSLQYKLK